MEVASGDGSLPRKNAAAGQGLGLGGEKGKPTISTKLLPGH